MKNIDFLNIMFVASLVTMIFLLFGGLFKVKEIEKKKSIEEYKYKLENVHDVKHQKVSTTFHDYVVIVVDGQVVDNGIIHINNCRCHE